MNSTLTPFLFGESTIRITDTEGNPWFVANDVCNAIGINNPRMALTRLDDDEKGVILTDTLGGRQNLNIISESGLYALVLRSDKPAAKPFRKWVTSEVLPAIRKRGSYNTACSPVVRLRF